ncbi:MAG: heavy metal transporter, partial [Marinirhabdus sp.]|nr:heavy metal transporter [Marinirhabdus sp.]
IPTEQLKNALPEKYTLTEKNVFGTPSATEKEAIDTPSKLKQLQPLFLIFGFMFLVNILVHYATWNTSAFMLDFMASFFFIFSFFKFLDIKGFAASFSMYDPIAQRVPFYGKIYPFLELALGILFLIRFQVNVALIATIVILGVTTIGVTRVLMADKTVQCACLGSVLNLPMTLATFIENAIMIVMALAMLLNWA